MFTTQTWHDFVTSMAKNQYYKNEELQKAWILACQFYNKEYKPMFFKIGNLKLQKNVVIFDLPSIATCKGACKACYALKAERLYKNTRIMRAFHYACFLLAFESQAKRKFLYNYINDELFFHDNFIKNLVVRLHSSGDFFSKKYLNFWLKIIKNNNKIKFYTYSKQLDNIKIDDINNKYNNFNIIKSIININNNNYINFGNKEYLLTIKKELKKAKKDFFVCDYGTKKTNKKTCMGTCKKCLSCPHVLFYQH